MRDGTTSHVSGVFPGKRQLGACSDGRSSERLRLRDINETRVSSIVPAVGLYRRCSSMCIIKVV